MTNSVHERESVQWPALISVALITILYAFNFTQSVVLLDSARDIYYAHQISQFDAWPMLGPDIGGFFHTGPIWFYFLAVPAFTGSLVFLALWIGAFSGLKFFLAYKLGTEVINPRFGLIWAFMLLLPGWHVINQLFIGHINMIETVGLFLLLMLYRFYLTGINAYWLLAALALGLGFQAHPSFLALLVFYLPVIWQQRRQLSVAMFLLASGIFILPMLPYIVDQLINDMPDYNRWLLRDQNLDQIRATGHALADQTWWQHWFENLFSMLINGPQRIYEFVGYHKSNLSVFMQYFYVTVMFVVTIGLLLLFKDKKLRKYFAFTVVGLFLALLTVTLMRPFTPFYMVLSLTPVLAGLFALGAYGFIGHLKIVKTPLLFLLFCLGFMPYFAVHKAVKNDQIYLGPVMNITQEIPRNWIQSNYKLDVLTVSESRKASTYFCNKSTVINGPFAPVIELTGGVTLNFFCNHFQTQLAGSQSNQQLALFVMHKSFWDLIEKEPELWLTPSWGLTTDYQNHTVHKGVSIIPFDPYVHPPRSDMVIGDQEVFKIKVESQGKSHLIVTNTMPANISFSVGDIRANGLPVDLLVKNAANRVYHCSSCGNETVSWEFDLSTNHYQAIDINILPE